ncbi:hypothetical protein K1T35_48125 (plasmid) [Pseudonocardia sp. DSM 110487]|uniref:hypothetical protein n=1 Tax=Pseudonocardia sp. DSM 110487 TaxID=2865833 RepID=UPI001C69CE49|nr:hypothetical protein [Pseudonocardia sp. DSM 110487]QYN41117.1 hypothetical protein K1T35_48125 [Pseudonocardia sp. DSM 110487]
MKIALTALAVTLIIGCTSETHAERMVPSAGLGVLPVRGPGPGPEPEPVPDRDGHFIVVYTDDQEAGEARCDELEIEEPLVECVIEPLSEQPDVNEPGWANRFREKWAGRG